MNVAGQKKQRFFNKRIPTLLGLGLLVVGLVVGSIIFGAGTGVFAPRATPETTPKNIKISNITDRGFTISFATDSPTVGFVKYGTEPGKIKTRISDDRDQLYGTVDPYPLHHITASGLSPNTTYYYVLGTGGGTIFDDNGEPFSITTGSQLSAPPKANTLYGAVSTTQSTPAEGSIVYANLEAAGTLSQLVQKTGSWVISLSNARTTDGTSYATLTNDTSLVVLAQGHPTNLTAMQSTTVDGFTNGSALILGSDVGSDGGQSNTPNTPPPTPTPTISVDDPINPIPTNNTQELSALPTSPLNSPGGLSEMVDTSNNVQSDEPIVTIVDLTEEDGQVVNTNNPIIQGVAAPNVTVVIRVNSETQIEQRVQANANGEFYLDIATLSEELEPGEHTVEYTYIDPITGQEVTETRTFVVAPPQTATAQLAQVNQSSTPATYGTDYPYSGAPSPTPAIEYSAGTSPTPTRMPDATDSAIISTTPTLTPTPTIVLSESENNTVSTQTAQIANDGTLVEAGSVGTTLALLLGGFLFMLTGGWSFWVAKELSRES